MYQAVKTRIELRSARIVSRRLLAQWPDATHLELDISDQGDDSMVPVSVRDASGRELADIQDVEDFDEDLASMVWNFHDDVGDWMAFRENTGDRGQTPQLDLKAAAAITDERISGQPQLPTTPPPTWQQQLVIHQKHVSDAVCWAIPDAIGWSVGTEEFDNGHFYDETEVTVKRADGSAEEIDLSGTEASDALAEIRDMERPGRDTTHEVRF
ncbi:MAG: hypothetical protein ACR2P2_01415 [Nakamurella sp.]